MTVLLCTDSTIMKHKLKYSRHDGATLKKPTCEMSDVMVMNLDSIWIVEKIQEEFFSALETVRVPITSISLC